MFFTLALYQHMLSPDSVASHRVALPGSLKKADELFSSEPAAPEAEETIEEELVDEGEEKEEESGNDLVLLYLRDAGSVPLLTHQGEVELAQEIEAGRAQVQEAVFSFPFTLHRVFELAKKVETSDLPLQALLAESEVGEPATTVEAVRKCFFKQTAELRRLHRASTYLTAELKAKALLQHERDALTNKLLKKNIEIVHALSILHLSKSLIYLI